MDDGAHIWQREVEEIHELEFAKFEDVAARAVLVKAAREQRVPQRRREVAQPRERLVGAQGRHRSRSWYEEGGKGKCGDDCHSEGGVGNQLPTVATYVRRPNLRGRASTEQRLAKDSQRTSYLRINTR